VVANVEMGRNGEADSVVESGPRMVVIEVKTGRPEAKITADVVRRLLPELQSMRRAEPPRVGEALVGIHDRKGGTTVVLMGE
jgi:hypothetical protein